MSTRMSTERNDERPAAALWTAAAFFATLVVSIAIALWVARSASPPPATGAGIERRVEEFPAPRLQREPRAELAALAEERESMLARWEWVDRRSGVCRIPIDAAIDLLVERGFAFSR